MAMSVVISSFVSISCENVLLFITTGAQRVTNTLTFTGCPTIQFQDKKMVKKAFNAFKLEKKELSYYWR
jgi:hypothetical protein